MASIGHFTRDSQRALNAASKAPPSSTACKNEEKPENWLFSKVLDMMFATSIK